MFYPKNGRRARIEVFRMRRNMPIGLQIRKIQEFLVMHGYDPETIDVPAIVDRRLRYDENKKNIARLLNIKAATTNRKQIDEMYCHHLSHECEIRCDNNACKSYRRNCDGEVEPCGKPTPIERVCPIPVRGHCISPYKRTIRGKTISVSGYCVPAHTRRCR